MKIGLLIDDLLRDVKTQVSFVNERYLEGNEIDLYSPEQDIELPYDEYAYDIFGKAVQFDDVIYDVLDYMIKYKEDDTIVFTERCFSKAIPSTLFFLSKTGLPVKNVEFYESYEELVENFDVIVTTNKFVIDRYKNKITIFNYMINDEPIDGVLNINSLTEITENIKIM